MFAAITEIRQFVKKDGSPEILINCAPVQIEGGAHARARVIWIDESGNASYRARARAKLLEVVVLLPLGRAFGEVAAWEVARADVRSRFMHAQLIATPAGYVIGVPDDPTDPDMSAGTFLCHPTPNYSDAWINAAVNVTT